MDAETLFLICNNAVMPAWLLLAVAPGWIWTQRLVHAIWIPGLLGIAYLFAMASGTGPAPEGAGFGSLNGVMLLFTSPYAVLAGWIHYLAFDLFVGAWEVRDAQRRGVSHLVVVPCLLFTLMFGPLGLLLYLAARYVKTKTLTFEEAA